MEAIPTPKPTSILPTMITHGAGAIAMTIAPKKNTTSASKIDVFLPNLSFIHPPTAAPMIAPATAILTIVSCKLQLQTWSISSEGTSLQGIHAS